MQDIHPIEGGGTRLFGADWMPRPHNHQNLQALKCPRCDSLDTKFCYYNNYSLSQPRYFCKRCRRYWTEGSILRNISVGGGCSKTKLSKPKASSEAGQNGKSNSHSSSERSSLTASTAEVVPASGLSSALPGCYSGSNLQQRSDQDGTIPFQQYYPGVSVEQLQSGVDSLLGPHNIESNSGSNLQQRSDQDGTIPFQQYYPGVSVEQLQSGVDSLLGPPNIESNSGSNLHQRSDQDGTIPFQQYYPGVTVKQLQSGVDSLLGRPNIEPNSGSNLQQGSDQDGTVPFQLHPGGAVEQLQLEVDIESGQPNDIEMVENLQYSNDDSVMKVAWIIFLIIAHHVFSSMWSTQNDSSSSAKSKWPFYFVGGVNAVGFISALCAIFLHPKKKMAARILVKIAAIAVACGIIVRMGMSFLPENMIWISFIPCLIPCIVVPLA